MRSSQDNQRHLTKGRDLYLGEMVLICACFGLSPLILIYQRTTPVFASNVKALCSWDRGEIQGLNSSGFQSVPISFSCSVYFEKPCITLAPWLLDGCTNYGGVAMRRVLWGVTPGYFDSSSVTLHIIAARIRVLSSNYQTRLFLEQKPIVLCTPRRIVYCKARKKEITTERG
jgi:hypothetical protein